MSHGLWKRKKKQQYFFYRKQTSSLLCVCAHVCACVYVWRYAYIYMWVHMLCMCTYEDMHTYICECMDASWVSPLTNITFFPLLDRISHWIRSLAIWQSSCLSSYRDSFVSASPVPELRACTIILGFLHGWCGPRLRSSWLHDKLFIIWATNTSQWKEQVWVLF